MPRLWTDLDSFAYRQENNKKEKKSITACVRCRNISLALSRSAWLLRWKWLLRHQHKHQHGQRQRLREAAASEAAAVAAAEAVAAAAATAINKTHTFCEADAHTIHTLTHIAGFSPSSPAHSGQKHLFTPLRCFHSRCWHSSATFCQLEKIEF